MRRSRNKSHWGEFPEIYEDKFEVDDVFSIYPPEKRFKLEMLAMVKQEKEEEIPIEIGNELVTKTVELMNHTNRIGSMISLYSEQMAYLANYRQVVPTITLSAETETCLEDLGQPLQSPFEIASKEPTDFTLGKPTHIPQITKPIAMLLLHKSLAGLLRIKGFDYSFKSCMVMMREAVEEFYHSFLDKINNVMELDGTNRNKNLDIETLEKAYKSTTHTSLLNLHNYYKNEIINRNRGEIIRFKNTHWEYEKMVEESEKIQKINLKEEYMNAMNNMARHRRSPSSSSEASSSYRGSNTSYDVKHYSDDNTNYSYYNYHY